MTTEHERIVMCDESTKYKGINHPSTVVVCNNKAEFLYMIEWCISNGKLKPFDGVPERYPFCIGTKDGSWTDLMDRALYYKSFIEFLNDIGT